MGFAGTKNKKGWDYPLHKSPGIFDDHAVRKSVQTRETYTQSLTTNIITTAIDYSIVPNDNTIIMDGTSNTVTITLPTASEITGKIFGIKCIDATNQCDVVTFGSEEIDGESANFILSKHEVITVQSDGSNWWII